MVSAILVCGGNSSRMGRNKMEMQLGGVPVWERTTRAFHSCEQIDEIILVGAGELLHAMKDKMTAYPKISAVVPGGATRQESAAAGFRAVSPMANLVAVHDGARPFVSHPLIARLIEDAFCYGAAAPAIPVKDTIKIRDEHGFVSATPARETLYACQTPQVFSVPLYARALAAAQGQALTDDCQMVEAIGARVYLTLGEERNFKLTTPADLRLAQLQMEEENEDEYKDRTGL